MSPHDITFRLATHGYMALAKSLHKNVVTLYTVDDDTSVGVICQKQI